MENKLDKQYQELLKSILEFGVKKNTRNGQVLSIFGYSIRHNMKDGFPLLTTKRMAWKSICTELMWFLRGDTNIKFLLDNDCHIWDGDAWANYQRKTLEKFMGDTAIAQYAITNKEKFIDKIKTDVEFAKKWGELGSIYGKQWRDWNGKYEVKLSDERNEEGYLKYESSHINGIDQIANLLKELKENPDSRRLIVSAWNVGELEQMVLPPCHYGFQMYTRELSASEREDYYAKINNYTDEQRYEMNPNCSDQDVHIIMNEENIPKRAISLMWNQRSVDTFLGLPFNIASYGLLLEILAKSVNMIPEELIGNLGDVHLYSNHIEQAKEQINREPYPLPKLIYQTPIQVQGLYLDPENFKLEGYQSHSQIKAPLSN